MKQLLGEVSIRVDGTLYPAIKGAKLTNPMGRKRTPVIAGGKVIGWTGETLAPMIEFSTPMHQEIDVSALFDAESVTATFECDNGQVFVLSDCQSSEIDSITSGDNAPISIKLFGADCQLQ